jgi:hypothetical protein
LWSRLPSEHDDRGDEVTCQFFKFSRGGQFQSPGVEYKREHAEQVLKNRAMLVKLGLDEPLITKLESKNMGKKRPLSETAPSRPSLARRAKDSKKSYVQQKASDNDDEEEDRRVAIIAELH